MIKINLLKNTLMRPAAKGGAAKNEAVETTGEAKPDAKAGAGKYDWGQFPAFGALACLFFCCFGGVYYFWLSRSAAAETDRNAALSEEKENLKPYLQLEERFKEQSGLLRKQENALTKLKKQQQFPVYFLQELANSLPDNVWFAKVASRGHRVEIRGESLTEDAIYQFRDNLVARDQWFRNVNFLGANRREKRLEFTIALELVQA